MTSLAKAYLCPLIFRINKESKINLKHYATAFTNNKSSNYENFHDSVSKFGESRKRSVYMEGKAYKSCQL